jgi:hypothetical protein
MTETPAPELERLAEALAEIVEPNPGRHFVLLILTDKGDETHVELISDLAPEIANEVMAAFGGELGAEAARINGDAH